MTKWPGYPSKYRHLDTNDADRFADEYRGTKPFSVKVDTNPPRYTWGSIIGSIVIGLVLGAILLYSCVAQAQTWQYYQQQNQFNQQQRLQAQQEANRIQQQMLWEQQRQNQEFQNQRRQQQIQQQPNKFDSFMRGFQAGRGY